ncbi:MAG: protein kinase [Oscillatoriales cyanobacterium C42_A2020_001]|nr:protein kinase [Leptolyngbyaceae cyanobacterium C42_A2020_001]
MISPLAPGTLVFNRYCVVGLAGQGEFGLTYLAQDQKRFDELCILKEFVPLRQDPAMLEVQRQCFHQEATVLYELQHAQLPHYRIMFVHGDRLYLVREYIVGKSCSALLNERRSEGQVFSQAEVLRLLLQVLPVLTDLHRAGIIHENLAPQSIVIRREEQTPVLIEVGLVKRLVAQLQLHPVLPDTPIGRMGYASPEQEHGGKVLPCSDVYSLGAIAMALLLGKEPQEAAHQWTRSPNWYTQLDIHPDFASVLKRMLHPNPQKRFASAPQVLRALEPIATTILCSEPTIPRRLPIPQPQVAIAGHAASRQASPAPSPIEDLPLADEAAFPLVPRSTPRSRTSPTRGKPSPGTSHKKPRSQSKADFKASAILVLSVALLVSVVSFRALSWVQTGPVKAPSPANTVASSEPATSDTQPSPAATVSSTMPTRESGAQPDATTAGGKPSSGDRSQTTIDAQFLSDLTDEVFYAKHPDLQGQKLTEDQKDLQNEWKAISSDVESKLSGLSPEVLSKLGSYDRAAYERWTAPDSGASLNSRELNVLVNNRFAELFPDQKGKSLNPKTFGQVWYALAEEELNKLKPQNSEN